VSIKYQPVCTYPVFCCLPDKGILITTCTGIAYNRIPSRPHKVIQFGQLDNQRVPVILIERSFLKIILGECRLEGYASLFLRKKRQ